MTTTIETTMQTWTAEKLAPYLRVSNDALRKTMKRLSLVEGRFDRTAPIDDAKVRTIAQQYYEYGSELSQKQAEKLLSSDLPSNEELKAMFDQTNDLSGISDKSLTKVERLNGQAPISTKDDLPELNLNGQEVEPDKYDSPKHNKTGQAKSDKSDNRHMVRPDKTDWSEVGKDALLGVIALVSMYVQMEHTASVVSAAGISEGVSAMISAWAFATAIQFTGLTITLYNGSLLYLKIFGWAEFGINLLYYKPWTGDWEDWTRAVLLSALLAFSIYSYAEIFAARRRAKTDNV